ncbi:MAG: DUF3810 family protein [Clostridiales bacterium]|nr:DUF3810 family protein [Clostridiales bacterium]
MKRRDKTTGSPVKKIIWRLIMIAAIILRMFLIIFLPRFVITRQAADIYCARIFPFISFIPDSISNMTYFSITENLVVVGSFFILIFMIIGLIRAVIIIRKKGFSRFLIKLTDVVVVIMIPVMFFTGVFQAMHGVNYLRTPVAARLQLTGEEHTYEEYEAALNWAYQGMIDARRQLGEDYNGVAHLSTSFQVCVDDANSLINAVSYFYDLDMSPNYVRAKPVMLSRLWGYTDIAGVYDPMIGESNINTDYLDILHFPVTLCHEIAHAKGYARENDANTVAVLTCIMSPRPDFKYAGYYYIFMRLYGTVSDYAEHEGVTMYDYFGNPAFDMVRRDIIACQAHDHTYETGPIADLISDFSESANDTFLEVNGQEGGTDTYVVPSDIYVDFFCKYINDVESGNNA